MSGAEVVLYEKKGRVAVITLNRPELNFANGELLNKLMSALNDAEEDQNIRCVLIMGAGEKAFSGGIDLKYVRSLTQDGQVKFAELVKDVAYRIARFKKPTIAAVHGYAIGLGYMIVVASDIRVAAQDAKFKIPEVELGMYPGSGITVISLKSGFPPSALYELILTCEEFDVNKADKLGIINKIVPKEKLEEAALSLARKISLADPAITAQTKKLIRDYPSISFDEAEKRETEQHFEFMKRRFLGK
nr:enoyl-CoA hydratase/isomerase family protein [Candidatus Njordarchaeum guaymaensis]